jgi:uncharacterized protein YutE (UPF0331/DUF86 family)
VACSRPISAARFSKNADATRAARGRLGDAAGLRNLLVHDYGDIDHARLWDSLGELDDLRSFATAAERLARG